MECGESDVERERQWEVYMSHVQRWVGVYRMLSEDGDIGTEAWTREVGPDGVRLTSVINRFDDDEFEEEFELNLDATWVPKDCTIERTSQAGTRRYVGRRVGDAWISQIFRESGPMRTMTLPINDSMHLDYLTAHTNAASIHRLSLERETGTEIDVIFIDPDTWTPSTVKQKYARLADPIPVDIAGETATRAYRYQGSSGLEYTIWTNEDEIILRYEDLFESIDITRASS
jgi:hypothetical protein